MAEENKPKEEVIKERIFLREIEDEMKGMSQLNFDEMVIGK